MNIRALAVTGVLFIALTSQATDSPQFRGAMRTGVFEEAGLMKAWPKGGPPLVWESKGFGVGFSSALVSRGRIYLTGGLEDGENYVFIIDMDGKIVDKIPYGKETTKEMTKETTPCPRSTPTVDGDRIYLLSGLGVVNCIALPERRIEWQVNIVDRFSAPSIIYPMVEALLTDGDRLICTPGGSEAVMAALDKKTGDTVWATKGMSDTASYVAPLLVNHNGRRIILTETSQYLICVDADTGALLWKHEHRNKFDVHAVTPVYRDGCVYFVGGYNSGGGQLTLSQDASSYTINWLDTRLDCQHDGVILAEGCLYGTSQKRNQMVCLDWTTGKVNWTSKQITKGVTEYADGMLYTYEGPRKGIVSLIKPSATGLECTGRFTVAQGTKEHFAHPTISNGRLYVRHGNSLLCYDLSQK